MSSNPNTLVWDGKPGHYEVYYLSATDAATGVGFWIRYTMVAPLAQTGEPATCSLWFMSMDPRDGTVIGRKESWPAERMRATPEPFELTVADAVLTDCGMAGGFGGVAWELSWEPGRPYEHVNPFLAKAKIAKTVLVLPHADVAVSGWLEIDGARLTLEGARGGQAHLWGSKHANRWAWAHGDDFTGLDGSPRPDTFLDGVSVFVPRFGREIGPSTPVVARIGGKDFASTSPRRVLGNPSRFGLTNWEFEAIDGNRRLVVEVDADRESLVGVTYHDPDGERPYCYNSETATMRIAVWERGSSLSGWDLVDTVVSTGRAHFEYAQREPVPGLPIHID